MLFLVQRETIEHLGGYYTKCQMDFNEAGLDERRLFFELVL